MAEAALAQPKQAAGVESEIKRRLTPPVLIAMVAGAVVLGALVVVLLGLGKESTDDAQIDADVVSLAPRVSGQVVKVAIVENQSVKKGDNSTTRTTRPRSSRRRPSWIALGPKPTLQTPRPPSPRLVHAGDCLRLRPA
jgi:membrane fusion protein (multidrug efflux system)